MAKKKLTKEELDKLKNLGIKGVKNVEDAREILIKKLAEEEVDDVEDDTLEELVDMYEAFYEDKGEEEVEYGEEAEYNAAAETLEDEEVEEEEAEEEKPKKKASKKAEPKKKESKGKAEPKPKKKEVAEKKAEPKKKATKKPAKKRAIAWDRDNEEHMEMLNKLISSVMPKGVEYEMKLLKTGTTVYLKLESGKRAMFAYEKLRVKEDKLVGVFFFQCLKGLEEVEQFMDGFEVDGEELALKAYNPNLIYTSGVTEDTVSGILSHNDLISEMLERLKVTDKRASKAKKNLEEKMKKEEESTKKPTAKKPTAKKPAAKKKEEAPATSEEKPKKDKKAKKDKKSKKAKK